MDDKTYRLVELDQHELESQPIVLDNISEDDFWIPSRPEFEELDLEEAICELVARTGHPMIANVQDDGTILVTDLTTNITCTIGTALLALGKPDTVKLEPHADLATRLAPVLLLFVATLLIAGAAVTAFSLLR